MGQSSGEQTYLGQHSPSGIIGLCPIGQKGMGQCTAEQSGTHLGQHSPIDTSGLSLGPQSGKAQGGQTL